MELPTEAIIWIVCFVVGLVMIFDDDEQQYYQPVPSSDNKMAGCLFFIGMVILAIILVGVYFYRHP